MRQAANVSNQTLHGRSVALFWLSNVQTMAIKKCIFSHSLLKIYYYIGNDSREPFLHSEWALARGINGDIGHKTKTELDANLRLFCAEHETKTNKPTVEAHSWNLIGMV